MSERATTFIAELPPGYTTLALTPDNRIVAAGPAVPPVVYDERLHVWVDIKLGPGQSL